MGGLEESRLYALTENSTVSSIDHQDYCLHAKYRCIVLDMLRPKVLRKLQPEAASQFPLFMFRMVFQFDYQIAFQRESKIDQMAFLSTGLMR